MTWLVVNDTHLGVQRAGGTTRDSAEALRVFLRERFSKLLAGHNRVVVNGDLFDTFEVPVSDMLETYVELSAWLSSGGERLHLLPGNHDLSKNSSNMSSFELMARLLCMQYPQQVFYLQGGGWIDQDDGMYGISHVPNQDLFELEISRVPEGVRYLLLHVNVDNAFACLADHSLNLSRAQAKSLTSRGITVVVGHEHQGREILSGRVVIPGNPFPSSVADCLPHGDAQRDGTKRALIIDGDSHRYITTWTPDDADGWYTEVDWKELADVEEEGRGFIRVVGDATVAESSDAIKAIATFRQRSKSFVVTNAVKVESLESLEELAESIEDVRSVNVAEMLMELLDPKEREVVQSLFEKDEQ